MNPRTLGFLSLGLSVGVLVLFFAWPRLLGNPDGQPPVILLPALLLVLGALILVLRFRNRRREVKTRPVWRVLAGLIGALLAVGISWWDRLHDAGGVREAAGDRSAPLAVLAVILLLAVGMVQLKRLRKDRDQRAR